MKDETPLLPFSSSEVRAYGAIQMFGSDVPSNLPFRYSRFTVEPGRATTVDKHTVLEVWVVLAGTGRLCYDGIEFAVKAGDAVRFDSSRTHQIVNDGAKELSIFSFWWSSE
jgi:mannose-6-phosphate isomerase-like protein (cupin superfamily)